MAAFLTVVVPTLNEEHYLERCLRSLMVDAYPPGQFEILVIDGGSRDRTVEVAERLSAVIPLRVLHNPKRIQAAAFNLALAHSDSRTTCYLRCDAHSEYAPGFARRAVAELDRTGAGVVGFAAVPAAEETFQRAVAFAQSTRAGVGGSEYRRGAKSGWVDSAMHGCFDASAVLAVGGYDESFSHNEDAELSLRLRDAGYGVWLDAELRASYFPRRDPIGLARQYFLYGRGRARTCFKHGIRPRPRQLAPVLLVAVNAACLLLGSRQRRFLLGPLAYFTALAAIAGREAVARRDSAMLLASVALAIMHHAWGKGFLVESAKQILRRSTGAGRDT